MNRIISVELQYLKPFNFEQIKLLVLAILQTTSLCAEMTYFKLNYLCYIAILETI